MTRRGTHRTNATRLARALQAAEPGATYQQLLAAVRSQDPPEQSVCVRCGDPLVADSTGTWHSVSDHLAFCDEFLAHDDLDDLLGGFAPSHQTAATLAGVEDEVHLVHPVGSSCHRCDQEPVPEQVTVEGDVHRLVRLVAHRHGHDWASIEPPVRARLCAAAIVAWQRTDGPRAQRHAAARHAAARCLSAMGPQLDPRLADDVQ